MRLETEKTWSANERPRRNELAIRAALGATPRLIISSVLREPVAMTVSGLMVGLAGALLSSRIVGSFLFGISAVDLPTYAGRLKVGITVNPTGIVQASLPYPEDRSLPEAPKFPGADLR